MLFTYIDYVQYQEAKFANPTYAFQILLTASVTPTSLVSNSYKPTPTSNVANFKPHMNNLRTPGIRWVGT